MIGQILLPDRAIDPWHLFNLKKLFNLLFIIQLIQSLAYLSEKSFGSRFGLYLMSFFGGIISSSAMVLSLVKRSTYSNIPSFYLTISGILSITGSFILMLVILLLNKIELFHLIKYEVLSIFIIFAILVTFFTLTHKNLRLTTTETNNQITPPSIISTLKLFFIIFTLISFSKIATLYFGHLGTKIVALIGGLFEIHGIVMAQINMLDGQNINLDNAVHNLILAMIASLLMKAVMVISTARNPFTITFSFILFITSALTTVIYFLH